MAPGFTYCAASPGIARCSGDLRFGEATLLHRENKKRNPPAELHICTRGGHGFGMRQDKHPINDWPQRCAEWMESMGFLSAK